MSRACVTDALDVSGSSADVRALREPYSDDCAHVCLVRLRERSFGTNSERRACSTRRQTFTIGVIASADRVEPERDACAEVELSLLGQGVKRRTLNIARKAFELVRTIETAAADDFERLLHGRDRRVAG